MRATKRTVGYAMLAALLSTACADQDPITPAGPSSVSGNTTAGTSAAPPTGCSRPAVPTNLRVTSMVRTTVELAWNVVPGATYYTLMVGSTPGGTDELFTDTTQSSFRFTARDGKSYARVQANNACGSSASTGSIEFFIPG